MSVRVTSIENRLRERIDELGLHVKTVAGECGVSVEYLYKVMRGDRYPSQRVQFALAHVLNTRVDWLFLPRISTVSRNEEAEMHHTTVPSHGERSETVANRS